MLVLAHGWNATAYQILNPGIDLWFTPDRSAVIGFVRYGRARVIAGAPVCDMSRLDDVAASFVDEAHRRGEYVCYFGAGDRLDARYSEDRAWSRVLLGAQPSWDRQSGPAQSRGDRRCVRNSTARAIRACESKNGPPNARRTIQPCGDVLQSG